MAMTDMSNDLVMRIVSESSPTRKLVTQRLMDAIVGGRFRPGDRLIERELCDLLGVSRATVREALRALESEGLIENIPNKGPIVSRISIKQAQDIYEMRAVMEGLAARLFTQRATKDQVAELGRSIEMIGDVYRNYNTESFLQAKALFYSVLLAGADNEAAANALRSIHVRVSQLRVFSLQSPKRTDASYAELQILLTCVKAGDGAGAEQACMTHVRNAATAAIAMMRKLEQEANSANTYSHQLAAA
jgi:GntR family transcriptional regulator, trigonelline degradation regulator